MELLRITIGRLRAGYDAENGAVSPGGAEAPVGRIGTPPSGALDCPVTYAFVLRRAIMQQASHTCTPKGSCLRDDGTRHVTSSPLMSEPLQI